MSSNYYLQCIILKNCPYSQALYDMLISNQYNKIKKIFTFIEQKDKDNYKTPFINTFPQVYLKKENSNGTLLLGGYDDTKYFFNTFYKQYDENTLNTFIKEKKWAKKSALRLIELINT